MGKNILIVLTFTFTCSSIWAQNPDLQKIESKNFKRLYQLNDSLYRAEQPNKKGFTELEALGIKTVINFRRKVDDTKRARHTEIQLERIPLKASELDQNHIVQVLKLIQDAEKPVLIHCWHGSDRTGAIAAAYRIVVDNWTKEKAIAEMRLKELSHHEKRYPNVALLLEELDVDEIKSQLIK